MTQEARPATYPWQEPVRGDYPGLDFLSHGGLDQLKAFLTGHAPRPPISYLTGMRITQAGPGQATFVMPVSDWMVGPQGTFDPTVISILADGPLGCALQSTLPPMTPYTTAELSINHVRPARMGGELVAQGSLIVKSQSMALTDVRVQDREGRLVAHGTSRCVILDPVAPVPDEPAELEPWEEPTYDTPAPYERPAEGSALSPDLMAEQDGLTVSQAFLAGKAPMPPITHLTGKRLVEAGPGTSAFVMPATEWLHSPFPRVEGGAIAMLAETTMFNAVVNTLPAGTICSLVDLKVNFMRPIPGDGRDIRAEAEVVHRGRTVAVSTSRVLDADGKVAALATGTCAILEGRTWDSLWS